MHVLTCPKCNVKLRLQKPLVNTKVRCSKCGAVFIGSTQQLAEPQAPPAARKPDIYHSYRPAKGVPTKGAPWMLIVVIVAIIGIAGAIFGAYWLKTHPYVELKDEKGRVIFTGRMQIDEYNNRVAEIDREKKKFEQSSVKPGPTDSTTSVTDHQPEDGSGETVVSRPLPPEETYTVIEDTDIPVAVTPKPLFVVEGRLDFVGKVTNKHDYPLAAANITVSVRDKDDTPVATGKVTVYNIPAKGSVPFSVAFDDLDEKQIDRVFGTALGEKAADGVVCWEVAQTGMRKDIDKTTQTTFVLTGSVKNPNDFEVADPIIYVDFFDGDGRHLKSVSGKLDNLYLDHIPAGKEAHFRVDYDCPDPLLVEKWSVRVVGKKS